MGCGCGAFLWVLASYSAAHVRAEIAHPGEPHWDEAEKTAADSCERWPLEGVAVCTAWGLRGTRPGEGREETLELVHSLEPVTFAVPAWVARFPGLAPLGDHLLRIVDAAVKLDIGVLVEARAVYDAACSAGGSQELALAGADQRREAARWLNASALALEELAAPPLNLLAGAATPLGHSYLQAAEALCGRLGSIAEPHASRYGNCDEWNAREEVRMRAVTRRLHLEVAGLHAHAALAAATTLGAAPLPRARFRAGLGLWRRQIAARLLSQRARDVVALEGSARPLRMVELGVDSAATAEALLRTMPSLGYIGVDPFADGGEGASGERRHTFAWLRIARFGGRANLLRMTSLDAATWVQDASLDLIWVDASHAYEDVLADLRAWIPKLRRGGVVAGHDYGLSFPGVPLAVHEAFLQWPPADATLHLAPDDAYFWVLP